MSWHLDWQAMLSIAATLTLYIVVALCAGYAWRDRLWLLAAPLTLIFIASTIALIWVFHRWGI